VKPYPQYIYQAGAFSLRNFIRDLNGIIKKLKPAGYSGTPLAKKLGIKEGYKVRLINQPGYYFELFTDLPEKLLFPGDKKVKKNFIHYFAIKTKDLQKEIPNLKKEIAEDGIIWVSWYKKSSKIPTDVTENMVRDLALANGLVDVKVCAIDEYWSGLKLVIPLRERKGKT
jgi:hypothetical protein